MSSKVVIVGVGALGSHVVQFLRNVDCDITVVDFDRVERKNVASQFHAKASVGKGKVAGLKQTMNFLFGTKINVVPHKLTSDNVETLLSDVDLVIDCLDNAESRQVIQDWCGPACGPSGEDARIPCLHGALAADGGFGRVVWSENFTIDTEPAEAAATCENGEFLPFIGITATYIARAAQQFLEDDKQIGYNIHPAGVFAV